MWKLANDGERLKELFDWSEGVVLSEGNEKYQKYTESNFEEKRV